LEIALLAASTCHYGFINGFVVANEVAGSLSKNDEEKKVTLDYFLPKLLISGVLFMFISVVAATIMATWF